MDFLPLRLVGGKIDFFGHRETDSRISPSCVVQFPLFFRVSSNFLSLASINQHNCPRFPFLFLAPLSQRLSDSPLHHHRLRLSSNNDFFFRAIYVILLLRSENSNFSSNSKFRCQFRRCSKSLSIWRAFFFLRLAFPPSSQRHHHHLDRLFNGCCCCCCAVVQEEGFPPNPLAVTQVSTEKSFPRWPSLRANSCMTSLKIMESTF